MRLFGEACDDDSFTGRHQACSWADLIKQFKPQSKIWVSSPTWANHKGSSQAGFEIEEYPYYDKATQGVDFDAMLQALKQVPAGM